MWQVITGDLVVISAMYFILQTSRVILCILPMGILDPLVWKQIIPQLIKEVIEFRQKKGRII